MPPLYRFLHQILVNLPEAAMEVAVLSFGLDLLSGCELVLVL